MFNRKEELLATSDDGTWNNSRTSGTTPGLISSSLLHMLIKNSVTTNLTEIIQLFFFNSLDTNIPEIVYSQAEDKDSKLANENTEEKNAENNQGDHKDDEKELELLVSVIQLYLQY